MYHFFFYWAILDNKRAKIALNRSIAFKGVIVQIVCIVEIRSESALALIKITLGKLAMPDFMHLRQVVLKNKISIFSCVFLWFNPRTPWGGSILDPEVTI